jgi:hypothetical protein
VVSLGQNIQLPPDRERMNALHIMKRVVLTDSKTKATTVFRNPPWRLGSITSAWNGTFDVRMIHEDGLELTIDVRAEKVSLTNRFKGWCAPA